ncbi:MAG: HoxN/HupN/NixA family nickel/cobalt transporter, partial [Armatimonadota bacterium]
MEFLLLALSSFGLGALHALEPGHGKTVVGAYLVGSKGRMSDAVLLGIVVTLTHSGSVILLGVLSTVAAAYFVPETVQKVLEVVSGLLVVGVGGWMFAVRIRQAKSHAHRHDEHGHDHHEHEHSHDHSHEHSHGGHSHSHVPNVAPGERPTLWQLVTLGISGGIVPCPAALAVLLAAVSYGQFVRGLSLVIIFSIGMAAVLVAIGIMMVRAANFAGKYVSESKWTKIMPVVSAGLITLVGV